MKRITLSLAAIASIFMAAGEARAQTPYVTYYQPTTVYYSAPAATAYVAPSPTVAYYSAPVSYYPTSAYYPAAATYSYVPTSVVTRYRPILGGTASRYVSGYAPVYYAY